MKSTIRLANRPARLFAILLISLLALLTAYGNEESIESLKKKAEAGDAKAQLELSGMYFKGEGVPKNSIEAFKWYRKAAERGFTEAQFNLGRMYRDGEGVPKDEVEAYAWFLLAKARQEWKRADDGIEPLEKRLTAEQREEGQQRAAELEQTIPRLY